MISVSHMPHQKIIMLHCGLAGLLICVNLKKLSGRVTRPCHLWGLVLSRLLASPLLSRWPKKGSCVTQYSSSWPRAPSTWHFNHGHLQPISSCILAALSPSVNIVSWRDVCNPIQLIPLAGPIHQALQPWSSTANFFINLGGLHAFISSCLVDTTVSWEVVLPTKHT